MLLLWIFSLAASFLLPATGEVVHNFSTCSDFFLDGTPPQLERENTSRICQMYKNQYRFATLYDRKGRIPVFSAYKYQPGKGKRINNWKIEPQLALPENQQRRSMESEKTCNISEEILKKSQAVVKDYKNCANFDRGHLLPVSHQGDQDSKDATFTLTNIVPQFCHLNKNKWAEYENNMKNYTRGCLNTYVIVGVVPGNNVLNRRVNIPSYIWAAACCVLQNNQRKSWAVLAQNNVDKVDYHTLEELQAQLSNLYGNRTDLFNNACNATSGLQN
ncbi:endonuclease domain-containing 1 protein-like [Pantherophis guttatus]|uniref:Endonuclease domain-containing 1 protein-like n=1 Tax=Pantherophis guttatus TaxID=94885 RepID=A0A6P9DJW0_PANGU|nr:endonuclease domain-containing 1 protein-like [Pantherophis guttatus]